MPATVWKGYLTFGLVSFPIRLRAAARAETIHFHLLHNKDLSRVKEVMYCSREDRPLERSELVKGFEYEKNRYLVIEPEELEKISPPTATVMEILQFAKRSEVDPIFFETSYYVSPEEAVSRPYWLLLSAMQETGYDAVAKVTMHAREHVVILRPSDRGIVLHTMYYVNELHQEKAGAAPKQGKFGKQELELAKKLIETLARPFEPDQFQDEYRANAEKLIENKLRGRKVTPIRQPKKKAPVVDLVQALQQSLKKRAAKPAVHRAPRATSKAVRRQSA